MAYVPPVNKASMVHFAIGTVLQTVLVDSVLEVVELAVVANLVIMDNSVRRSVEQDAVTRAAM